MSYNNQSIGFTSNQSYPSNSSLNGLYYSFGQSGSVNDKAFLFKSPSRSLVS
jgi:hypothetical protein